VSRAKLDGRSDADGGAEDGSGTDFRFEYVTVTFLQELSKFAIALFSLSHEVSAVGGSLADEVNTVFLSWAFLPYCVPGVLYCIDNNFQYVILHFLQPAELAILWNFKMFATVILLRVFLGRQYAWQQWAAMLTLVLGCILTQAPTSPSVHGLASQETSDLGAGDGGQGWGYSKRFIGAVLAIIGSCIAASSNVFCEWLVKQRPEDSLHLQNLQLYFFGVVLNAMTLFYKVVAEPSSPIHGPGGFLAGYTFYVWLIVFLGSISGIAISATLKFADNIVLIFAHALSVLIVAVVSSWAFGITLSPPFVMGGFLVLSALVVFHCGESSDAGSAPKRVDFAATSGARAASTRIGSSRGHDLATWCNSSNSDAGLACRRLAGDGRQHARHEGSGTTEPATGRPIPMYCIT